MPNYSRSRSPCVAKSGTIYYVYYLAYVDAPRASRYEVVHHDAIIEEKTHEQCLDFVKDVAPDFILMDTSTPSIRNILSSQLGSRVSAKQSSPHVGLSHLKILTSF